MSRVRSSRPSVRSVLSKFLDFPLLQPPSRKSNTDSPHRIMAENTSVPLASHAGLQSSVATIVSTPVAGHVRSVISPPSQIGHSCNTSLTNDVPSTLHQTRPQSSEIGQSHQLFLPTAQYHQENDPVHYLLQPERSALVLPQAHINASLTHQCVSSYPAQSAHENDSVHLLHHAAYKGPLSSLRHPQVEKVPHLGAPFEQGLTPQPPQRNSNRRASRLQPGSPGLFYKAHDFVINDAVFVDSSSDTFMASFLKETLIGAEFDSSDPHMPLRCHPRTRSEIIQRCHDFILNREGRAKLRWVVGAAGVGKSAIMQSVAHDEYHILADIIIGATLFFSINGRREGTKAIITIAYQLAVKLKQYRSFVQREVTHDPSLLQKSISKQFAKFIVEPFVRQHILGRSSQLLIIIDGLDECADPLIQQELLGLITDFCTAYPTSPIVWMIASRPEPHIASFFSQPRLALSYEKEAILVDSDEARDDVKRYLRDKFTEVQVTSITLQQLSRWPVEGDLLKIANASGGLFAYASAVVRYISDPGYGDPVLLLDDVLKIIETGTNENIWGRNHPMAQLDALYSHIMRKIPANVMADTRKLLLLCSTNSLPFQFICNLLGMTQNTAYGATHDIRSIANVPGPADAADNRLTFFHKSFPDYLRDFRRSGFSSDLVLEAEHLRRQCALRILHEAPGGVYVDGASNSDLKFGSGAFKNGLGTGDNISVSWPATRKREIGLPMFRRAVWEIMTGLSMGEEAFRSLFCIRVLTTCFTKLPLSFPFDAVREFAFDKSRRRELLERRILKQIPLGTLDHRAISTRYSIRLCFRSPTVDYYLRLYFNARRGRSNPWDTSCEHEREGCWEGQSQDWSTSFWHPDTYQPKYRSCYCFERFIDHFKTRLQGHLVTVLDLTPTSRWVELRFVDPDDGVSEWIYHFITEDGKDGINRREEDESEED